MEVQPASTSSAAVRALWRAVGSWVRGDARVECEDLPYARHGLQQSHRFIFFAGFFFVLDGDLGERTQRVSRGRGRTMHTDIVFTVQEELDALGDARADALELETAGG